MPKIRKPVNSKLYTERLKTIRPFVDFNYNLNKPLSRADKAKINKYYKAVDSHKGDKFYRVNVRHAGERANKIAQLQKLEGEKLPGLKGAFLSGPEGATVEWHVDTPTIITPHIRRDFVPFNPKRLAANPDKEIDSAMLGVLGTQFTIAAGPEDGYQIPHGMIRSSINGRVKRLMARYDGVTILPGRTAERAHNQNWRNWLTGVHVYNFENQWDAVNYAKEKNAAIARKQYAGYKRGRNRKRRR